MDPTTVWEVGYADNGLTPSANAARWESTRQVSPVSSKERSGRGKAPVAMMGMASPTGYLDLVNRR